MVETGRNGSSVTVDVRRWRLVPAICSLAVLGAWNLSAQQSSSQLPVPQDRLRIAGKPLPGTPPGIMAPYGGMPSSAQQTPAQVVPQQQSPITVTGEQAAASTAPQAGPGQLFIPGMPFSPSAPSPPPKVVGKGYIRYSYKGSPIEEAQPQQSALTETPQGRVYTIVKGDCLWNIAGTFYSDPWRWREIWERNPYITNPDLIYPGNQLVLGLQAQSAETVPPQQPLDSSYLRQTLSFSDATAGFLDDTAKYDADSALLAQKEAEALNAIHAVIKRKVLTSEFLARSAFLWSQKDERGLLYPGNARIDPRLKAEAFQQYEEVPLIFIGKSTYNVGDSVEFYRSERMVTFKKRKANLVRRVGRGYVVEVKGKRAKAVLTEAWDAVKPGDRVGRAQPFPRLTVIEYVRPERPLQAQVFERVEQTLFPYPFHSFIIDRGAQDGVRVGDLFVAYRVDKEASPSPAQLACAVHVGNDYATLATVVLYQNALKPGDRVEMVRRVQATQ